MIGWQKCGGATVREPSRPGFGSTIIERAIPHELGGFSEIRFASEGVQARLVAPTRSISDEPPAPVTLAETGNPALPSSDRIEGVMLLVEDNLLIALDTEESLQTLGAEDVHIASSVAAALSFLRETRPDFAVLDYNLGREHGVQVAERLERDGFNSATARA